MVENRDSADILAASAPWEITGAIAWQLYTRSGNNDRRMMMDVWHNRPIRWPWFAAMSSWFTRWNGEKIEQGFCANHVPIYTETGLELWVWNPVASTFQSVKPGWSYGCSEASK